jgi:hypothetical protein
VCGLAVALGDCDGERCSLWLGLGVLDDVPAAATETATAGLPGPVFPARSC